MMVNVAESYYLLVACSNYLILIESKLKSNLLVQFSLNHWYEIEALNSPRLKIILPNMFPITPGIIMKAGRILLTRRVGSLSALTSSKLWFIFMNSYVNFAAFALRTHCALYSTYCIVHRTQI